MESERDGRVEQWCWSCHSITNKFRYVTWRELGCILMATMELVWFKLVINKTNLLFIFFYIFILMIRFIQIVIKFSNVNMEDNFRLDWVLSLKFSKQVFWRVKCMDLNI